MTSEETANILKALTQACSKWLPDITAGGAMIWAEVLRDVPYTAAKKAVVVLARDNVDFPTPNEFHRCAKRIAREQAAEATRALPAPGTEEAPYVCACQDTGMVEVDAAANTYRPCDRCNQPAYERWEKGLYRPKRPTPTSAGAMNANREQIEAIRAQLGGAVKRMDDV